MLSLMDMLLLIMALITIGIGLLAYDELGREGKFLDSIVDKLRHAIRRAKRT